MYLQPRLPTSLLESYLSVLIRLTAYPAALDQFLNNKLFQSDKFDSSYDQDRDMNYYSISSNYQQLIHMLSEQSATSSLTTYLSYLVNFIAFIDELKNYTSFMSDILLDIEKISEAINWKHAACENFGGSNNAGGEISTNQAGGNDLNNITLATESENDRNLLHLPSQAFMEIYQEISKMIHKLITQYQEVENSRKQLLNYQKEQATSLDDKFGFVAFPDSQATVLPSSSQPTSSSTSTLLNDDVFAFYVIPYLNHFSFFPALLSLNSLRLLSIELAVMLDWEAPFYLEIIHYQDSFHRLMNSLLKIITNYKHWEVYLLSMKMEGLQQLVDQIIHTNYHYYHHQGAFVYLTEEMNSFFLYKLFQLSYQLTEVKKGEENPLVSLGHRTDEKLVNDRAIQTTLLSSWFFVLLSQHCHSFFTSWSQVYEELNPTNSSKAAELNELTLNLFEENLLFLYEFFPSVNQQHHLKYGVEWILLKYYWKDLYQMLTSLIEELSPYYRDVIEDNQKTKRINSKKLLFERVLTVLVRIFTNCLHDNALLILSDKQILSLFSTLDSFLPLLTSLPTIAPKARDEMNEEENESEDENGFGFASTIREEVAAILKFIRSWKNYSMLNEEALSETSNENKSDEERKKEDKSNSHEIITQLQLTHDEFKKSHYRFFERSNKLIFSAIHRAEYDKELSTALSETIEERSESLFYYAVLIDATVLRFISSLDLPSDASKFRAPKKSSLCNVWAFFLQKSGVKFPELEKVVGQYQTVILPTVTNVAQIENGLLRLFILLEHQLLFIVKILQESVASGIQAVLSSKSVLFKLLVSLCFNYFYVVNNLVVDQYCSKKIQSYLALFQKLILQAIQLLSPIYDLSSSSFSQSPDLEVENELFDPPTIWTILLYFAVQLSYDDKENSFELLNYFMREIFPLYKTNQTEYVANSLKQLNTLVNEAIEDGSKVLEETKKFSAHQQKLNVQFFQDILNYSLLSSSQRLHNELVQFIHQFALLEQTSELPQDLRFSCIPTYMQTLSKFIKLTVEANTQTKANLVASTAPIGKDEPVVSPTVVYYETILLRLLFSLQSLLQSSTSTIILFLQESLFTELFSLIQQQSPSSSAAFFDVVFVSLQLIQLIYSSLDRWYHLSSSSNQWIVFKEIQQTLQKSSLVTALGIPSNLILAEGSSEDAIDHNHPVAGYFNHWNQNILHLLQYLSVEVIDFLPSLLKTYREHVAFPLLLNQSFFFLYQIIGHNQYYWVKYLANLLAVGEGFTIEFLCIKLWVQFEEAFQYLYEMIDIKKQFYLYSTSTTPSGDNNNTGAMFSEYELHSLLLESFEQVATATSVLKIVLELVVFAYESNKLTLSSLAKCMRMALIDPRKVILRYQRMFSLWMTTLTVDFITQFPKAVHDLYHARQVTITLYLKHLVEITAKFSKYQLSKEEKLTSSTVNMREWMIPEATWFQLKQQEVVMRRKPFTADLFVESHINAVTGLETKQRKQYEFIHNLFFQYLKKLDTPHPFAHASLTQRKYLLDGATPHLIHPAEKLLCYDVRNALFYSYNNATTTTNAANTASTATSQLVGSSRYSKKNRVYLTYKEYYQHIYQHVYSIGSSIEERADIAASFTFKRRKHYLGLYALPKEDNDDYWDFQQQYRLKNGQRGGGDDDELQRNDGKADAAAMDEEEEDDDDNEDQEGNEDINLTTNELATGALMSPTQNQPPFSFFGPPPTLTVPSIGTEVPGGGNGNVMSDYEKQFQDLLRKVDDDDQDMNYPMSHQDQPPFFGNVANPSFPGGGGASGAGRKSRFGPSSGGRGGGNGPPDISIYQPPPTQQGFDNGFNRSYDSGNGFGGEMRGGDYNSGHYSNNGNQQQQYGGNDYYGNNNNNNNGSFDEEGGQHRNFERRRGRGRGGGGFRGGGGRADGGSGGGGGFRGGGRGRGRFNN